MNETSRLRAALLVLWTLLLLLLPAGAALAEEPQATAPPPRYVLDISLSSRPSALVFAGDVTLSFTVANRSAYDVQNVYLTSSDGLHSEPIGQILAGDTQSFNRVYTVSDQELEAGEISFIISHDAVGGSEQVNYTVTAPIERSIAQPRAEFTCQLSSRCVAAGGQVVATYQVRNSGNVPLSQLRVTDALGDFIGRIETLAVGETRVLISRVSLAEEASSQPALSYAVPAEDGRTYGNSLSPRRIRVAKPELSASFAADRSSARVGETVRLTLMLQNLGDADYRHITVYDAVNGGVVASSMGLQAGGEPLMISRVYPVRGPAAYQFRVEALSETGEAVTLETERVSVPVEAAPRGGGLDLTAAARTPQIRAPGGVAFDLTLSTEAVGGVRHVTLSEQNRGEIRSYEIVPPGEPIRAEAVYSVGESGDFVFLAEWTDEEGTHIVRALPVEIEVAAGGAEPLQPDRKGSLFQGFSVRLGENSVYVFLMIAGCLVLAGLLLALWITSRKARRARRERQDLQRRKKEDLSRTNRFVPVKRQQGKRPAARRKDEPPKS